MSISDVHARFILDSRGNPTVEAEVLLDDGSLGRAAVPSGASTGKREAVELRDGGKAFGGQGVKQAITNVTGELRQAVIGLDPSDQTKLDEVMIKLDGTPNKSRLGANAILAVSLASAKASAIGRGISFYEAAATLAGVHELAMPMPMVNVINGGKHAAGSTDIQEFMIVPVGATTMPSAVQMCTEVFHALGKLLAAEKYATSVGDEGGYAPALRHGNEEALELLVRAITAAGYQPGHDIALAIDAAASELVTPDGYRLAREDRTLSSKQMIAWYADLAVRYPLVSIEDGLGEDDWSGWAELTAELGNKLQIVGDDLLVTDAAAIIKAAEHQTANAVLIKPNQVGTLTETIAAVKAARAHGWRTIMSHRSGETEDVSLAHLAVGLATGQIKTGSMSRSERTAKYNELLRIAEGLKTSTITSPF